MGNDKSHWETVYNSKEITTLGWYEETPGPCIALVEKLGLDRRDAILDMGCGASTFIDYLADSGYENIIACDISEAALDKLKARIGNKKAARIQWIVDDITRPAALDSIGGITLWHDRAMLHFLRGESEKSMYLSTLKRVVKSGGYAIIAVFSATGARKCSGLDLQNYDEDMLKDFLGGDFDLMDSFSHTYHMPSGDPRPYIYTLFQRK